MARKRTYESETIAVQYEMKRCIHAEECVRRLHVVFNQKATPWIQPDKAAADQIAATVLHCPTGALHYERKDGGENEGIPDENVVRMDADGPLYVHGDIEVLNAAGEVVMHETRIALCRCGASNNKPFCDNAHLESGFKDPSTPDYEIEVGEAADGHQKIEIKPTANGPYRVQGQFEVVTAAGRVIYRGHKTWLCRCGGSQKKPFCDGTHNKNGFQAE